MAKLEVLQCATCGSPLSPGALKCAYCGAQNLIRSEQNALRISSKVAKKYIAFYSEKTKENPKDTNALYSMGLLYLAMKNYELAQRNFKDAIDQSPLDSDVYFYYTLALAGGKNIAKLTTADVERMEQYLGTAANMETKCKYLVLQAVLKEEYYVANKMVVPGKEPRLLWNEASEYTPDDLEEILDNCTFREQKVIDRITAIKEGNYQKEESFQLPQRETSVEHWTAERIEKAKNLDSETRRNCYEYWHSPLPKKYSIVAPIVKRALWLVFWLIVSAIVLLLNLKRITDQPTVCTSVNAVVATKEITNKKKFTEREKGEIHAEAVRDSIVKAENFDAYFADRCTIFSVKNKEGYKTCFVLKITIKSMFLLLGILALLSWWAYKTWRIVAYEIYLKKRTHHNYQEALEKFLSTPYEDKELQLPIFISNFLSKVVDMELKRHGKSEKDFKGITLFSCWVKFAKPDGMSQPSPLIAYDIITLEEDCITMIQNNWFAIHDEVSKIEAELQQMSYSQIETIIASSELISIGNWTITKQIKTEPDPDGKLPQIFEYQDQYEDPVYNTYSTTRTSDFNKFAMALRKLVQEYKSKN